VPATADELDPWYRLGFGQMQLEAIRASGADRRPLPEGVSVRVAGLDDLERIARELGMLVWQHQQGAATFTGLEPPDLDAALASWVDDWDAASDTAFVAERGGKLLGCTVYERPSAAIGTPVDAVALAFSAVAPAARGQGVGVAMAEHSFAWASETGHGTIVVDWRVPNLLASRFWPARGFRPTFHRLHRMTVIG
jgi:GNAT superfamily N-acetyltransferase